MTEEERLIRQKKIVNNIKIDLTNFDNYEIKNQDLEGSELLSEFYSRDLILVRNYEDRYVYLFDTKDRSNTRLTVSDLKIIINNVAFRKVTEEYELEQLEEFLKLDEN